MFLAKKHCSACNVRLDRLKKSNFNQVTNATLIQTISQYNSFNKTINTGDLVCKKCIIACKRNKENASYGSDYPPVSTNDGHDHNEIIDEDLFDELVIKDI